MRQTPWLCTCCTWRWTARPVQGKQNQNFLMFSLCVLCALCGEISLRILGKCLTSLNRALAEFSQNLGDLTKKAPPRMRLKFNLSLRHQPRAEESSSPTDAVGEVESADCGGSIRYHWNPGDKIGG